MQIASSASIGASDSRSASEYATTASMPRARHARSTRSAISPRLAMRTRLTASGLPVLARGTRPVGGCGDGLDDRDLLPVLDRLARLGDDLDERAVDRCGDVLGDAEQVDDG